MHHWCLFAETAVKTKSVYAVHLRSQHQGCIKEPQLLLYLISSITYQKMIFYNGNTLKTYFRIQLQTHCYTEC